MKLDISPVTRAEEIARRRCNTIIKLVPRNENPDASAVSNMQVDWISEFCAGVLGCRARIFGVQHELEELLHARGVPLDSADLEYHHAALFFAMDSALECLAYAMNAIGWACAASDCKCYSALHDEKALRNINLSNFRKTKNCSNSSCPTFAAIRACWQLPANQKCIDRLTEQHDVTKHRRAAMSGHGQQQSSSTEDDGSFISGLTAMAYNPPADYILHTNIKTLPVEKAQASALGKPSGRTLQEQHLNGEVYFLSELMADYNVLIEETARRFESDIEKLLANAEHSKSQTDQPDGAEANGLN